MEVALAGFQRKLILLEGAENFFNVGPMVVQICARGEYQNIVDIDEYASGA